MALEERIRLVIETVTDRANTGLSSFRTAVGEADGVMGKFKAGAGAAMESVKANAGALAMAGGAALVAFGVKAVSAFQETALAAGAFSEAAGVSVENASRLREVSDDLGISADTTEGAIRKMNMAIANGKAPTKEFADQIVYAKDGSVDSYESFINLATAIGKIKDPTERAKAAQETFGKSYGDIAEMMSMSAEDLRAKLNSVSEAKVISSKELDQARNYRDSMANLKDILEDFEVTIGSAVVPALTDLADALVSLNDLLGPLGSIQDFISAAYDTTGLDSIVESIKAINEVFNPTLDGLVSDTAFSLTKVGEGAEAAGDGVDYADRIISDFNQGTGADFKQTMEDAAEATRDAEDAYKDLKGTLSDTQAWLNVQSAVDEMRAKLADGEASYREQAAAVLDTTAEVADYVAQTDKIKPEVKTSIYAALEQGGLDGVLTFIDTLSRGFDLPIFPKVVGGVGLNAAVAGKRAAGGPVDSGKPYLVGENGPEVVVPDGNGTVIPNHALGGPTVVKVYIGERELSQIVRSEVSSSNAQTVTDLRRGTR